MRKVSLASALLIGLTMAVLVVPAYALDLPQLPPLTLNFTNTEVSAAAANFLIGALSIGSVRVSWDRMHLNGQLVITYNLVTITFNSGSYTQNFSIQGAVNATLSGTHNFTGTLKIHLGVNAAPPELVDFHID